MCMGFDIYFKKSLIIHEENTKKNRKRVVSLFIRVLATVKNSALNAVFPITLRSQ